MNYLDQGPLDTNFRMLSELITIINILVALFRILDQPDTVYNATFCRRENI